MDFNYLDIGIAVIILITALIGFMRGFIWMAIFLATWAAAILLAIQYKDTLATALPIKLGSDVAQTGLAALLIFVGVLIVGAIINYLFSRAVAAIGLGTFDRILGTGLGIALGALAISLSVMLLALTEFPNQSVWKESRFIPKFQEGAEWLKSLVPEDMNKMLDDTLNGDKQPDSITSGSPESLPEGITPGDDATNTGVIDNNTGQPVR